MLQLSAINHFAIICSNYQQSKDFYTSILGFKVINELYRADRDSYKCDLALNGNYLIELFSFPNPPSRLSYPEACGLRHLAFVVDDLQQAISQLELAGITVEAIRKDEITSKNFTFFSDPDGLPIELVEA
jgi:glyoxylase I family protein